MALAAVLGGLQAAEGVYELGAGAIGSHKDAQKADELRRTRPKASANPSIKANLALAESELSNPDAASTQAIREGTDGALGASLGALISSGGTPNDVAAVFANDDAGRARMAQYREQLRLNKVNNLSAAYAAEAQDQMNVFDFNNRQWFDETQANAAKTVQDRNMVDAGISNIVGGAANYVSAKNQEKQQGETLKQQKSMYDDLDRRHMERMNDYFNPPPIVPPGYDNLANFEDPQYIK